MKPDVLELKKSLKKGIVTFQYKKKDGREVLILTNVQAKLENGYIQFPKSFYGFSIVPLYE